MSDQNSPNTASGPNQQLPAKIPPSGNLLNAALAHLPLEQQQALAQRALERQIELDAAAAEAQHRYQNSSRDMDNTVDHVRELERSTKSDYTVRADYKTASGSTTVEIKKANNTVIIVIAIVIGVLVLLMFSK